MSKNTPARASAQVRRRPLPPGVIDFVAWKAKRVAACQQDFSVSDPDFLVFCDDRKIAAECMGKELPLYDDLVCDYKLLLRSRAQIGITPLRKTRSHFTVADPAFLAWCRRQEKAARERGEEYPLFDDLVKQYEAMLARGGAA